MYNMKLSAIDSNQVVVLRSNRRMNKTLVALRSCTDNSTFSVAKFANCLAHHFNNGKGKVSVPVQCKLEDNLLKLSPGLDSACPTVKAARSELYVWDEKTHKFASPVNTHNVILHHSRECPIGNLSEADKENLPADIQNRGVDVAVAIMLESKDKRVLMTRRPNHMRTFPRAWVPPGGHIEINETLIDAALRELKEETGIALGTSTTFQVYCLWESVYPFILGLGLPSRHHVVVYLLAKSDLTSDQFVDKMKLDPEEVDSCAWMTPESVKFLISGCSEPTQPPQVMYALSTEGNLIPKPMTLSNMFHKELWGKGEIFSGSQLALVVWYESFKISNAKL